MKQPLKIIIILFVIIVSLVVVWLILALPIFINDAKENRERAELFYKEDVGRYEESGRESFEMKYTYSYTQNLGFYSGGGYIAGTNYWERFIKDAWTGQEIISLNVYEDKETNKETERKIEEFWEKHKELFGE